MLDFILGIYLAGLGIRGWLRGLVRELLDLAGLVVGIFVAFRLSQPLGDFLSDRFDVTPEWARIGSGIALFVLVGVGMSIAAHFLSRLMKLPGLNLANRLAGAGFAVAWGLVLMLVAVSLLRALPMPSGVDETLDDSVVLEAVAGPEAVPQRLFQGVVGDDVIDSLLALEPLLGRKRVVLEGDDRAEIEPAAPDEIEARPWDADTVFRLINDERVAIGREPLTWSEGLANVAGGHAEEMYLDGYVSHVSPRSGTVADRVNAADIRLVVVGENLALASTARSVHAGLMESPGHRENLLRRDFDRVGVAAVHGPLGLMVVEVFGG